jgi:hypothetical protein
MNSDIMRNEILNCVGNLFEDEDKANEYLYTQNRLEKDIYHSDPPYKWMVEYEDERHIMFTNGVFYTEVEEVGNEFNMEIGTLTIHKNIKLPFKERRYVFENVFEAIRSAINVQEEIDEYFFTAGNTKEWIPYFEKVNHWKKIK